MQKPNILRRKGCPNCQTEAMEKFFPIELYNSFKDPERKGPYGSTFLLVCSDCGSEYFEPAQGSSFVYLLAGRDKTLFYEFYDEANRVSPECLEVLQKVGAPGHGQWEYPVTVRTRDAVIKTYCVVRLMKDIWPPSLRTENFSFLKDVTEVFEHLQAMTLEQRVAAYEAPEAGMGYAPLWLEHGDQVYRTSCSQFYIPESMGRPEDFVIPKRRCSDQAPWINKVPYELFIGRLV